MMPPTQQQFARPIGHAKLARTGTAVTLRLQLQLFRSRGGKSPLLEAGQGITRAVQKDGRPAKGPVYGWALAGRRSKAFHTGDAATVWGVTPNDFKLTWMDGGGAPGHTGLTVFATTANKPEVAVTIEGAVSGQLNVQFGRVDQKDYMEISRL